MFSLVNWRSSCYYRQRQQRQQQQQQQQQLTTTTNHYHYFDRGMINIEALKILTLWEGLFIEK